MPIRKIDPKTGAISFILTEEEEKEQNKIRMIETLMKKVEELEIRVKELESKYGC